MKLTSIFLFFLTVLHANAADLNFLYFCSDSDNTSYNLFLGSNNSLQAKRFDNEQIFQGNYEYDGKTVKLNIPSIGYSDSSLGIEIQKNFLIAFVTPLLKCHIIGHNNGPAVEAYAKCPSIKYIPSVSYEKNAFEFSANHMVKRRQWKELVSIPDTIYSESYGIYYIEGNKLYMAFGDRKDENYLSGDIAADGNSFTINELEPNRGPCQ